MRKAALATAAVIGTLALGAAFSGHAEAACTVLAPPLAPAAHGDNLSIMTADRVTLTGGCIDGIAIGQNAPAAGNFSTLTVNGVAVGSGGLESDPVVGSKNGIIKADGAGNIFAAVPNTDYLAPGTPISNTTGNLPVSRLNGGAGASSTTCWYGDGLWKACGTGGGGVSTNGLSGNLLTSDGAGGFGTPIVPAAGVATLLGTFNSANLLATLADPDGTGSAVFSNSPSLSNPDLGIPSAVNLQNATNIPAGQLTGSASVSLFNGGINASSATCLYGDATWKSCGGSGGSSPTIADTHSNSITTPTQVTFGAGFVVSGTNGATATVKPTNEISTQTGTTYTLQTSDAGTIVHFTNASPVAVTLLTGATLGNGYGVSLQCDAGCVVSRAGSDTINGATALTVGAHQTAALWSDGTSAIGAAIVPATDPSNGANLQAASVLNAKLATMNAHTYKGNNTGSAASPLDLTQAQLTAELNAMVGDSGSGGTKGLVPAPAAGDAAAGKYLKADGTWAPVSGSGSGTVNSGTANQIALYSTTGTAVSGDSHLTDNGSILTATQAFALSGAITPAALTADVNDYSPTGISTASAIRVSASTADRTITGLTGGVEGRIVTITNNGTSNNVILANVSSSSSAGNKFNLAGSNVAIAPNTSLTLRYDGTAAQWRPFGSVSNAASGATALVSTVTADGTSQSISFSGLTGTDYTLRCLIKPVTNAVDVMVQYSEDGGSTFIAANYEWATAGNVTANSVSNGASTSDVGIKFKFGSALSNTSFHDFALTFFNLSGSVLHRAVGNFFVETSSATRGTGSVGGSYTADTNAVNGLRVTTSSGNIASGSRCSLYSNQT